MQHDKPAQPDEAAHEKLHRGPGCQLGKYYQHGDRGQKIQAISGADVQMPLVNGRDQQCRHDPGLTQTPRHGGCLGTQLRYPPQVGRDIQTQAYQADAHQQCILALSQASHGQDGGDQCKAQPYREPLKNRYRRRSALRVGVTIEKAQDPGPDEMTAYGHAAGQGNEPPGQRV